MFHGVGKEEGAGERGGEREWGGAHATDVNDIDSTA